MDEKQKGFFGKILDKIDGKLKTESEQKSCCCEDEKQKGDKKCCKN